jgi:hypothetical protein
MEKYRRTGSNLPGKKIGMATRFKISMSKRAALVRNALQRIGAWGTSSDVKTTGEAVPSLMSRSRISPALSKVRR